MTPAIPPPALPAQGAALRAAPAGDREAVRRAARGLEEVLIKQMLEVMARAQLEADGFFGAGAPEGARETTFELLLSQALAERGPLGLADQLTDQLARQPANRQAAEQLSRPTPESLLSAAPNFGSVFTKFTPGSQVHVIRSEEELADPQRDGLTVSGGEVGGPAPGAHESGVGPRRTKP